jgi:hypothetical protein
MHSSAGQKGRRPAVAATALPARGFRLRHRPLDGQAKQDRAWRTETAAVMRQPPAPTALPRALEETERRRTAPSKEAARHEVMGSSIGARKSIGPEYKRKAAL